MEFHSPIHWQPCLLRHFHRSKSFWLFCGAKLFGYIIFSLIAPGPSQHKKLLRLFSCHDPSSWKADDMKEPLNVDVAIHFICISLSDVLKIYIPWKQRNSLKLIPSRREKVLFICTEWADISKRNYMNRLFLVCLRPVQSPEVIMQQSPAWRPEQWQCYCYTELFTRKPLLWRWKAALYQLMKIYFQLIGYCFWVQFQLYHIRYQIPNFYIHPWSIPENVEDVMIVGFSIVNSLKIFSYWL